jgi:hypothetical protein
MGWIVDRIVNTDAPAVNLAQQASIKMLEARRAERNYLLLHDAIYLEANREALDKAQQILENIKILGLVTRAHCRRHPRLSRFTANNLRRRCPSWTGLAKDLLIASRM